ncbi:zinc transporter ZIP9-like [Amphibalanus amphitrite]|uniref:zinc transporter ZIP9-like n=1 Tax=Amphibalanus amphitrite TaxID=1232801 RepID=UPI001C916C8D|nr:zinc transporter ZIP9-like [Amphibalanus amphitrite]XP_043237131.1 zinc transporter ZIP9-like [Amphibalanus amphitrite]XP_043237132.1 zinc transporter ZIP9-like [Amphibalanus amphitrite]XP_043237134.1 zinc transporter ZIP9-like [Amphibalanus amphitrite]
MDGITTIILFSLAMLVGCYLAGLIPLTVTLSETKLQYVTLVGAGLLVGTALAVIIPEGVNTIIQGGRKAAAAPTAGSGHSHTHGEGGGAEELHSLVGLALVSGFILMLLVDQCTHRHSGDQTTDPEGRGPSRPGPNMTATVGLVVHAAADGVALGAAVASKRTDVELIVFVAIMLHKAPAAFGLVTFLLHEGLERARVRRHLLVFSVAAPLMALVTFFGIGQGGGEALADTSATGLCLLFSAGTFLYVSTVHVLPEVVSRGDRKHFSLTEMGCLVGGCLLPVLLSLNHHH